MQLFLIRHAQSENNLLWAETGSANGRSPDPLLTALGWQQARRLAQHLAQEPAAANPLNLTGYRLTHLYCSLMLRAVQTGTAVAAATGLPLVAWEPIHEWGGIFEEDPETGGRIGQPGPDRAYFEQHYPHLLLPQTLGAVGWWNRPAEMADDVLRRAEQFAADLIAQHGRTDDRVALITHGGFYNVLMGVLFQLPRQREPADLSRQIWFKVNNTAITRVDIDERGISLAYQNRLNHLSPDMISY